MGLGSFRMRLLSSITSLLFVTLGSMGLMMSGGLDHENFMVSGDIIIVDMNGNGNYTSIQDAINAANHGDTIQVWSGQYFGTVLVNRTVTLIGVHPDSTIINGNQWGDVVNITAGNVNISGFTIKGGKLEYPHAGVVMYDSDNTSITDCHIKDNELGVRLFDACNNRIDNCSIYDNKKGIKFFHMSSHNQILDNGITSNHYNGLVISAQGGNYNEVRNNSIMNNDENSATNFPALWCESHHNVISNNRISFNDGTTIYLNHANNNSISNNTFNTWGPGIRLYGSANNIIEFNNGTPASEGIYLSGSSDNIIRSNNISGSTMGIWLESFSNSNMILNNSCVSNTVGISTYVSENNTITNNYCGYNSVGIQSSYDWSSAIKNNHLYHNYNSGIEIDGSILGQISSVVSDNICINSSQGIYVIDRMHTQVERNICQFNTFEGIKITANDNFISNNRCDQNGQGGIIIGGSSNTITNNECDSNMDYGIEILGSNNTVSHNSLTSNGLSGISLDSALLNTFKENRMYNCGLTIDGVYQSNYDTHSIDPTNLVNNRPLYYIENVKNGIILEDAGQVVLASCTNITISNQSIENTSIGIIVAYSTNVTIEGCSLDNNIIHGVQLHETYGSALSNNTIVNNSRNGLYLKGSSENILAHNTLSDNGNGTFFDAFSEDNLVYKNTIMDNLISGVTLISNSNSNDIYHNNIIDNHEQASDLSHYNHWSTDQDEGNYWSDYLGDDNGNNGRTLGDGIGDTEIPHLGLDNFPFIEPNGWYLYGIPTLIDPGTFDSDGDLMVEWSEMRKAEGYILQEDVSDLFSSPTVVFNGSSASVNLTGRENGTYYYRVKAYDAYYTTDWSNIESITIDWLPDPPKDLQISVHLGGNVLNLSWKLNTVDTIQYDLYFKMTGDWSLLVTTLPPTSSFDHTGLENGERYYYRLQAKDHLDQVSDFSDTVFAIPKDSIIPAIPTGLIATANSNDSVTLTWTANIEEDLEGYNIYRSLLSHPYKWGSPINRIDPIIESRFVDSGLEPEMTYYYVVTALDEEPNESGFSEMVSATTLGDSVGDGNGGTDQDPDSNGGKGLDERDAGSDDHTYEIVLVVVLIVSIIGIFYFINIYNRRASTPDPIDPEQDLYDSLYSRQIMPKGEDPLEDVSEKDKRGPPV